jgi:hypothetical protein
LEEALDLSFDRLLMMMMMMTSARIFVARVGDRLIQRD